MSGDLNAHVGEDERIALAATPGPWHIPEHDPIAYCVDSPDGSGRICKFGDRACSDDVHNSLFIARHDPARALREVTFKRAMLAMHEPRPFWGNNPPPIREQAPENAVAWYCECQCPDGVIEGEYPCETVRLLTAVYEP